MTIEVRPACVLCLDGAGINHDGPFQLIQSRVMEVGPERWETRRIPCFCECHAIVDAAADDTPERES